MLGDKYSIKINYDNKIKELKLNFQSMKNIYSLTGENPFEFIGDFSKKEDKTVDLGKLVYCMSNADISLVDLNRFILSDKCDREELVNKIINLLVTELISEYVDDSKDNKSEDDDNDKEKVSNRNKLKEWFDFWNNCYYVATVQLHKSEEEFLNMTIRELKTLDAYNLKYYKDILIGAYIDIMNATNKVEKDKSKQVNKNIKMSMSEMLSGLSF